MNWLEFGYDLALGAVWFCVGLTAAAAVRWRDAWD